MPDVTYVGGHAAVEIDVDNKFVTVAKGDHVTVSDEQAKEMCVSDAWTAKASKSTVKEQS